MLEDFGLGLALFEGMLNLSISEEFAFPVVCTLDFVSEKIKLNGSRKILYFGYKVESCVEEKSIVKFVWSHEREWQSYWAIIVDHREKANVWKKHK